MTAFTEVACLTTALNAEYRQRQIMAKIVEARSKIIDLQLDLDDAITEMVNVAAWADEDTAAEQKIALDAVTACRKRLASAEAKIAKLLDSLVESC